MARYNILYLIISFGLSSHSANASVNDTTKSNSIIKTIGHDFNSTFGDGEYLFNELITQSIGHIIYPAVAVSSTYIASQFDERIRYPEHSQYNDAILKQAGQTTTALVLPSAIYLSGLIISNEEVRTTGRLLFESLIIAGATNGILKFSLGRARPYMNLGNNHFEYFDIHNDYQSLPSGHTTVAFTCASLLSARIDNIYADIALYGIACGTAYERIRSDNHWFSDVVLGAGIGIFSSYSVLNAHNHKVKFKDDTELNSPKQLHFAFIPQISSQFQGISLVATW